ncbi:hypothetical protein E2C01_069498 [Portunus trituberculatus]|uniref:Uncharacterized protein n=1 Tax=Portunus trituberculatus TaxID=210409 RepID=A0A5B7HYQ2_PORTR|nr:hypothetical protein [Portunus trituberculatus]
MNIETRHGTEGIKLSWVRRISRHVSEAIISFNPFSTRTRFHIHSAYYLVILHSFRNLHGD